MIRSKSPSPSQRFLALQFLGSVTRCALSRCRLVEEHHFAIDRPHQLVASVATHIPVHTLQRKRRALVVIEEGWPPPGAAVAVHARRHVVRYARKLRPMRVLVAFLALRRRALEVDLGQLRSKIRRFMAVDACYPPVRPRQRKGGFRMIELCEVLPILGGVAGFAA